MNHSVDPQSLDGVPLFKDFSPDQLADIASVLRRKVFPSGAMLMAAEQPGDLVYLLTEGTVKVYVEREDGTEVILAVLGPGEVVGEMSIIEEAGRSANVTTIEKTTALWIGREDFRRRLTSDPALSLNLMRILAGRLRLANAQIQALSRTEVEGRVAWQLLALAERYGVPDGEGGVHIPLRLTQTDLANIIGASRERVNQVLVSYRERGYISADASHHFTVHNSRALEGRRK